MGWWVGLGGLALVVGTPVGMDWFGWAGALAFCLNLAGFGLIVCGLGFAKTGNLMGFALSGRNSYSFSRLQMACWTVLVVAATATIVEVNLFLLRAGTSAFDIGVPGTVFAVMGIAGFSTAAAPAILTLKSTQRATTAARDAAGEREAKLSDIPPDEVGFVGRMQVLEGPGSARLINMLSGDEVGNSGTIDLSKVQQMLITGLLLAIYAGLVLVEMNAATQRIASLPAFNDRLAELLAISHATYLGYKVSPKPSGNP